MRMRHHVILSTVIVMFALPVLATGQSLPYPKDPQTGWAVGANKLLAQELKQKLDAGEKVLLIDVRDEPLYEKETIPGAIHIPFASVQDALKDIPKDRTLVFRWMHGTLSSQAAKLAEDRGYKTATFCPIQSWKDQGYTTEPGKKLW